MADGLEPYLWNSNDGWTIFLFFVVLGSCCIAACTVAAAVDKIKNQQNEECCTVVTMIFAGCTCVIFLVWMGVMIGHWTANQSCGEIDGGCDANAHLFLRPSSYKCENRFCDDGECCARIVPTPCAGFSCPDNLVLLSRESCSHGEECTTVCCAMPCANFSCPHNFRPLSGKTCSTGEECTTVCCEAPQAISRCNCTGNESQLHCETGKSKHCVGQGDHSALHTCWKAGTLCVSRPPSCTPRFDAELGGSCGTLAESACKDQAACQWDDALHVAEVSCTSAQPELATLCAQRSVDACAGTIGCETRVGTTLGQVCGPGTYRPCTALQAEHQAHCEAVTTEAGCLLLPNLCRWEADDNQCNCPATHVGPRCENSLSLWQSHEGLCLANRANPTVCDGIVLGVSFAADHPSCAADAGCAAWHRIKELATTIHRAAVLDLINDAFNLVFIVGQLLSSCFPNLMTPKGSLGVMVVLAFVVDIIAESIVIAAASSAAEDLDSLASAFCFSQGSGYEAVLKLREQAKDIQIFATVMIVLAVLAVIIDVGSSISNFANDDKEACLLSAGAFVLGLLEMIIGIIDLAENTNPLISDLTSIEEAVLGRASLESGYVCVQRNPVLPAVEPTGFQLETGLVAGVSVTVLLLCLICSTCAAVCEASASLVQA